MPKIGIKVDIDISVDGNMLSIIAKIQKYLRQANISETIIHQFTSDVKASQSYTAQLGKIAEWVYFNNGEFDGLT